MTMWTVFSDKETGKVLDAHDQDAYTCKGGDATCGSCCQCFVQMVNETVTIHYDVTDKQLDEMIDASPTTDNTFDPWKGDR